MNRVALVVTLALAASAQEPGHLMGKDYAERTSGSAPHVLFFSKAASWEQKIVHRDKEELSYIEKAVRKLGEANGIAFTFSKDGTIFTPANLANYDALFFYTSGELTFQQRNGRGDNYPLMTLEGKKAFLDAIENGLGFIGCNTANYTFTERVSPGEKDDATNAWRYTRMIGSGYMGHNEVQPGRFSYLDRSFPGMESVPADYRPVDQWYAFNRLMPDLHVVMALDAPKLTGNLYGRASYPVAWARMQGKGRVFYTTMGHTTEIWQDPVFLKMLLGGVRWAAKLVDANVEPDIPKVTPEANEIPAAASKFVSEHPPEVDPHFPNFKVWLDKNYPMHGAKRVLVYTKSAGYEHPLVYRDTAWPSPLDSELLNFGQEHEVDFVFTKDGTIFTPEKLAEFDAILFYTSGDPCVQPRNGLGDNYPLMPKAGMTALLAAVRSGKGFIGIHSTSDNALAPLLAASQENEGPLRRRTARVIDAAFPGMKSVPSDFASDEEAYAFKTRGADLHLLLTTGDATPAAWARMEAKGRVFYTSLGHSAETWKSAAFRQMLLGAIHWTTRSVDAEITTKSDR
ncbi:MAG: ThuA domain-containing protein [Chthoniobacteraceae bacterium]